MALSPMMKQYFSIKKDYEDCIVLFRLGDFYEMFHDDAIKASKILDLVLTGRDCGEAQRAPMCGVPYHAITNYIQKLISAGLKVAICEQMELPEKGMAERKIVRVITPGTVIEDNILDEKNNNFLAVVCCNKENKALAVAWCDISTGELFTQNFDSDKLEEKLQELMVSLSPSEILCNAIAMNYNEKLTCIKNEYIPKFKQYYEMKFDEERAKEVILQQFKVHSLEIYGIERYPLCIKAVGALLSYINETQMRALPHIDGVKYINSSEYMSLDYNTRRNLELTCNNKDQKKRGSLLWLLDKTITSMGARMLKQWINQPLVNIEFINDRLDMVESFVDDFLMREGMAEALSYVKDIERICGKISYGNVMPKDYKALEITLKAIPKVKEVLNYTKVGYGKRINSEIITCDNLIQLLNTAISEDAPTTVKESGYIKKGYNKQLDELIEFSHNGKALLSALELKEREKSGIKSLKIGYNKVFGYYIEISNSFKDKAPIEYIRKQTLVNCERYITEQLKTLEEKLLTAEDNYSALERKLYNELRELVLPFIPTLQKISNAIAKLDALLSLSKVSVNNGYSKPLINQKDETLTIKGGRHPIIEEFMRTENFVSNDTILDCNDNRTMILTGPNMAGKSTYMRQVALITIMAHIGCFVSADKANIPITDKIFTRVGASDDLLFNQSTFMVEMIEAAYILKNATRNSLIIIDELGRGTSNLDGLSIAQAVIEYINQTICAKTIFATHYFELSKLEGQLKGINSYKMMVTETKNGVIFLRKICKGSANKSFGIEVAAIAGIEKSIVDRAKIISNEIEKNKNIEKAKNEI
ncbi:MAG: DNA mismatch repair protein MutS [Clostridia bacterium]